MGWIQFILALPEMFRALQGAKKMWDSMKDERFYVDLNKAQELTDKAQTEKEYEEAVIAWRNAMRSR
jgi:hypothetical protein